MMDKIFRMLLGVWYQDPVCPGSHALYIYSIQPWKHMADLLITRAALSSLSAIA